MEHHSDTAPDLRRQELFFWIFAIAALFFQLGTNALWGPEARVAETVREMVIHNDYLHPALNGEVRFDKPLLGYWLTLPFVWLLGETCEMAVRIPAALAALAALFGTVKLAETLFDRPTAKLAGWLLLGSYGFLFWGRTGTFDMMNMAITVLAVTFFLEVEKRAGFQEYLVFWLLGFSGALTKGVSALIVPLVLLLPWQLCDSRWKRHMNWRNLLALAVGGAIYFFTFHWPTLTGLQGGLSPAGESESLETWELVFYGNFLRRLQDFHWSDLIDLPRFLLPWSPLLILALAGMLRHWRRLPVRLRRLFWGTGIVLLLLGLFTVRRWHCIMPLIPFLTVFGAEALMNDEYGNPRWNHWGILLTRYAAMTVAAFFIAFPVSWPLWMKSFGISPPGMALIALPLAGITAWWIMLFDTRKRNPVCRLSGLPGKLASPIVAGAILTAGLQSCVLPAFTQYRTEKPFFSRLRQELAALAPDGLFFFNTDVPETFLYYYNTRETVASAPSFDRIGPRYGGQRLAVFCRNRPGEREKLALAAASRNIRIDVAQPLFQEPSRIWDGKWKNKNFLVYLVDIPEHPIEE